MSGTVAVFELAPLRKIDVRTIATAEGVPGAEFLKEVDRASADQFANRPITLRFLLNSFRAGKGLPRRKPDLYREGCVVLCDEWRDVLRRSRQPHSLSLGLRFAVAGRLAAMSVFCRRTAIWTASRGIAMPDGDVRVDELLGEERFGREVANLSEHGVQETLNTGLFRSLGPHRFGFSHQTYEEFLAAQYLVDYRLPIPDIVGLILHPDGSGKVVPQLRETAAWLAALVPEVAKVLLAKDPAALFASDTPPSSEDERRELVRQILRLYDAGELFDIRGVHQIGRREAGARLRYAALSDDLKLYVRDKSKRTLARSAAILMAQLTGQAELQQDLTRAALDEEDDLDVRVMAAAALRTVGDENSKAALKRFATAPSASDLKDELKGAALAATWPEHLSADELFKALTLPKKANFIGEYERFLRSDFAAHLRLPDAIPALEWAEPHLRKATEHTPLGSAALSILTASIAYFEDSRVCDRLAEILVQVARTSIPCLQLMSKLSSRRDARIALARSAIRLAPDPLTLQCLRNHGVIESGDVPNLLDDLASTPAGELQEKIAFLIADLICQPKADTDLRDRVSVAAEANPVLATAIKWVVNRRAEQEREIAHYEAIHSPHEQPATPEAPPNLDDLMAALEGGDVTVFWRICDRLPGTSWSRDVALASWSPNEEVLPGWDKLKPAEQTQIIHAAQMYLNGYCATTYWIENREVSYVVICGYWALRLLARLTPDVFKNLSVDVWRGWMQSIFGDDDQREIPDEVQARILKTAYQQDPARFRDFLSRFINAQNKVSGDVFILDRLMPIWDRGIADLLRTRLQDESLQPHAYYSVLEALIAAGDEEAADIARDLVTSAADASPAAIEKPLQAALVLLKENPPRAWQAVWATCQSNAAFAEALFSRFAIDPYSSATTRLLTGLGENELAELQIWLLQHHLKQNEDDGAHHLGPRAGGFTMITSNRGWHWLSMVVMSNLIERGTPEAREAIHRIKEAAPDVNLDRAEKAAEEVVRQKTWEPLSPRELIDLVSGPPPTKGQVPDGTSMAPTRDRRRGGGRRPDVARREAIKSALIKHGDKWREHLSEIFTELDNGKVSLGDFQTYQIDLGDGQKTAPEKWDDLDLAIGSQRNQILDVLRKYAD